MVTTFKINRKKNIISIGYADGEVHVHELLHKGN